MRERAGLLWILAAAVLWGTTGTAQALGPTGATPVGVGLARLFVAAPALLGVAVVTGTVPRFSDVPKGPVLVGAMAMAVYQPAFFTAVDRTGVALGTVVAIGSAPILTGLLEWAIEGRKPGRSWSFATFLAVVGVATLASSGSSIGVEPWGLVAALAAGLSYAVYVLASRRVVQVASPAASMALVFLAAAVLSLPLLAVVELDWLSTSGGIALALHLGLIATALAYLLFARGLRSTGPSEAATASLAEPVTATLLGVIVLGERPGAVGWAGVALVLAGLVVLVRGSLRGPAVVPY